MATVARHVPRRSALGAVLERDLVHVSGKGGVGKTSVAAALGLAAAGDGRRALVCEVAGAQRLADAFGGAQRVWSCSIDARAALVEWMRLQPGGAVAAAVFGRAQAFTRFVDAAPGAKELITIAKAIDLARSDAYDVVVVDGASTGHALGMLSAPATVGRVAPLGPVGGQARELHAFLADPERTAYAGVALPEEMALHELLELEDGLRAALGRGLDLAVVDGVYPDRFTDAEAIRLEELAAHGVAAGRLRDALRQHRYARVHAARVEWLGERTPAPVVTLPFVFGAELGPREYELLARRLSGA